MYSVTNYGRMIGDNIRTNAYQQAIQQLVNSDSVVVDLGAGLGILSFLACAAGARKVYAIEPDDVITVAQEIARQNGFADRIVFIQELSQLVELPEKADVIVSDLHGVLPFCQHLVGVTSDARKRFLAPNGSMIPRRDNVRAALVDAEDTYHSQVAPWKEAYGFDVSAAKRILTNSWQRVFLTPDQFVAPPQHCVTLDYYSMENPNFCFEIGWDISTSRTAHGVAAWFDCELADNVSFSSAPGLPKTVYGQGFFPFTEPIRLESGDKLSVKMEARLVNLDYVFLWETTVNAREAPRTKHHFTQSTFEGRPLSLAKLHKRSAGYVPALNNDGEVERYVLESMDGKTTLKEISEKLNSKFPDRFDDERSAFNTAAEISLKFSR